MMKKIIYISPFNIYPPTNGGGRFIFNYINELSLTNEIIYFGLKNQDKIPIKGSLKQYNLFDSGVKKYISPISYWKALIVTKKNKPNLIIVAMPYQAFFAVFIAKLHKIECYLHEQNIEFLRFRRIGKWWWPLMYVYEALAYLIIDKVLYISDSDKEGLVKFFHISENKLEETPYIVDRSVFKQNKITRENIRNLLGIQKKYVILFFGPLDYKPNAEALKIILNKISPKVIKQNSNVKFLIVGKNPPKNNKNKNIIFTGFVDKIEDYINASDLVIVPLLSGGGVRTKILESLACNKRVITTSVGCEGIDRRDYNNQIFVSDKVEEFVQLINERVI